MFKNISIISALIFATYIFGGCERDGGSRIEGATHVSNDKPASQQSESVAPSSSQETSTSSESSSSRPTFSGSSTQVPSDFSNVVWLHTDVSSWAETATLNVSISGGTISLNYDKAKVWKNVDGLNANPWIFVYENGIWYAATFEWLRGGQTSKPVHVVNGDHIKISPLGNFKPQSGQVYGFMVSGLARAASRNVQERSNVCMVRWP